MALAFAMRAHDREGSLSAASLLMNGGLDAPRAPPAASAAAAAPSVEESPEERLRKGLEGKYVIILTQVLPDGLGDVVFGQNAAQELSQLEGINVLWIRCYSGENHQSGERLIGSDASNKKLLFSWAVRPGCELFAELRYAGLDLAQVWAQAQERFLAPWIFGLSAHEEPLLGLVSKARTQFWALTEYGRGMGNIHTYTGGMGVKIPTGWVVPDGCPLLLGGVFSTIRLAPHSGTDWRQRLAEACGIQDTSSTRLWWFYSRGDDEKKHDVRFLEEGGESLGSTPTKTWPRMRCASKVVPVRPDGGIIVKYEKTSGEKLCEQLFEVVKDPNYKPVIDVSCAEVTAGSAGQLSQFIWSILYNPAFTEKSSIENHAAVDIIVAPNLLTQWREVTGQRCVAVRITQLDLIEAGTNRRKEVGLCGRRLFLCGTQVPREELRAFLEQCEEKVFTTGDQSLAEAMFMGKDPCIQPDAKVQQWHLALKARASGQMEKVPDLGVVLRKLVTEEEARQKARLVSELESSQVEQEMTAQLGGGPSSWPPTQQVLARAGMLG